MELFYASEVLRYDNDRSECRDYSTIVAINAVQPINFKKNVDIKDLQSQVLHKLKEIFNSQFPGDEFSRYKYKIENWPSNVNILKKSWTKRELEEINEGLPFYRFYLSKTYNPMQRMENTGSIKNNISKTETLKFLFDRFKAETGRKNAQRIEWKMLDRSEIPKKYGNIFIDNNIISLKSVFENREIVDNIHFYKDCRESETSACDFREPSSDSMIIDDSDSARNSQDYGDQSIVDFSEMELEYLNFALSNADVSFDQSNDEYESFTNENNVPFQKTISRRLAENSDSINIYSPTPRKKAHLILLKRYREETGEPYATRIYWNKLDRRAIPDKYNDIKIDIASCSCKKIYRNPEIFDNIHFFANDHNSNDSDTINQSTETDNTSVHDSIESEVPRSAEILQSNSDSFSGSEPESEGNECNGYAMQRKIRSILLKRYREETGNISSKLIYWDRLDRRAIPSKYDKIQINRLTIKTVPIYGNPEIFDNIHFFQSEDKATFQKTISRRLAKHPDSTSPSTNNEARLILLKRYREETNDSYASQIFWKRLDRRAIPAKYDDIQIDTTSCAHKRIYRNPEIFDNIHFSLSAPINSENNLTRNPIQKK